VAFCSKMDESIDLVLAKGILYLNPVAGIAMHKEMTLRVGHIFMFLQGTGNCLYIQGDELPAHNRT
jgi:hypothetical protein